MEGRALCHLAGALRTEPDGGCPAVSNPRDSDSDGALLLTPGESLPSGTFAVAGRSSWARGDEAFEFAIGTAVPLRYDTTCAVDAPNRFRAGELHARVAGPGQRAVVRIVFADCQEPTVVVVPDG